MRLERSFVNTRAGGDLAGVQPNEWLLTSESVIKLAHGPNKNRQNDKNDLRHLIMRDSCNVLSSIFTRE
jgi:hypothetical protein